MPPGAGYSNPASGAVPRDEEEGRDMLRARDTGGKRPRRQAIPAGYCRWLMTTFPLSPALRAALRDEVRRQGGRRQPAGGKGG
jgi:hypothetical protein